MHGKAPVRNVRKILLAMTSLSIGLLLAPTGGSQQLQNRFDPTGREFLDGIERDQAEAQALGSTLWSAHVRVTDWLAAQTDDGLADDLVTHLQAGSGLPAASEVFSPFTADERTRFNDADVDIRICGDRLVSQLIPTDGFIGRLPAPYVRRRNRMGMVTETGVQPWGNSPITDPDLTACGLTEGAPVLMGRWRAPALERRERLVSQTRVIDCPVGEVGRGIHQTRQVQSFFDGFDAAVPDETITGAWTETSRSCRAPRSGDIRMAVECTITVGHRAGESGTRILSYPWSEGRHPDDSRVVQKVVDWTSPTVEMDFCRDGTSEDVDVTTVHDIQTRNTVCTVFHSAQWTRGGPVRQERDRYTSDIVFPPSWNRPDRQVVAVDPWRLLADDCRKHVARSRTGQTRTGNCPSGYTGSGIYETWVETWTDVEYADPVPHVADHVLPGSVSRVTTSTDSRCTAPPPPSNDPDDDKPLWKDKDGNLWRDRPVGTDPDDGSYCHCGGHPGDPSDYPPDNNDNDDDDDDDDGGGGCFLTTAVIERRGEADDGPTLTLLRGFRDGWLSARPEGRGLIAEYYELAPSIVASIPADDAEWDLIADEVDLAAAAVRDGRPEDAFDVYSAMVRRLEATWLD